MSAETQTPTAARPARRGPSRGFWIGMLGVFLFALALTFAGAVAAARNADSPDAAPGRRTPYPTVVVTHAPRMTTPPDNFVAAD